VTRDDHVALNLAIEPASKGNMATTEVSLACWILGLDNAEVFMVDITLSKTVDHLKKAIKKEKENRLNHLDADQLDIWKVNDPAQRTRHY
jgi:hypothetical protein